MYVFNRMCFKGILTPVLLLVALTVFGIEKTNVNRIKVNEATLKIVGDNKPVMIRIPPPESYTNKSGKLKNGAKITVTYNGFTTEAKSAFQEAVDIWASIVQSPVDIKIEAYWRKLGGTTLGSCGPTNYYSGYDGMPYSNTYYPIALSEKLTGEELNDSTEFEMFANFNSSANWYYGKDGNTPSTKYDLVTVVLHEICHGLGFIGSYSVDKGLGSWGWGTNNPFIFDRFIIDAEKRSLLDTEIYPNYSKELKTALTSGQVFFDGPIIISDFGKIVMLFSPSTWDEGSSIYHVSSVYAATNDALMNQSLNMGKSVHDPGTIATSILFEMGWKQVRFEHEKMKNSEEIQDVEVTTRIIPDFPTMVINPKLFYSKDSSDYIELNLIKDPKDTSLYTATIPVSSSVNISYYMTAEDKYGRKFKMPVTSPNENYLFYIGADTISPDIKHYPNNFLLPGQDSVQFTATVTDGFEIDSVWLAYSINGVEKSNLKIPLKKESKYQLNLDISAYNLQVGDSLNYRIGAVDKSETGNIGYSPRQGTIRMIVEAIPDFVESLEDNFEILNNNFILQGFEINQPDGFPNNSLNSPHPYDFAGEGSSLQYIAQIRFPVKVIDQFHYISFDEIALVEPGDEGSDYGDENFWDYVIVEASKDQGNKWIALEPGWDCRRFNEWFTVYNQSIGGQFSQAVGNQSMFRNHLIDILGSGDINVGDEILIRFRFYSDPYANGWGWSIDNLKIQTPNVGKQALLMSNNIVVYPNPVKNGMISIDAKGEKLNEITVFSLQGAKIYTKKVEQSEKRFELPAGLHGAFMLELKSEKRSEHVKIMVQ